MTLLRSSPASECPMPTNTGIIGIMCTIWLPESQPRDRLSSGICEGVERAEAARRGAKWRNKHHTISTTTITVVTCMIFSALSPDLWNALDVLPPEVDRHQHGENAAVEFCLAGIPDESKQTNPAGRGRAQVLTCGNAADRPGRYSEHQRRHGKPASVPPSFSSDDARYTPPQ